MELLIWKGNGYDVKIASAEEESIMKDINGMMLQIHKLYNKLEEHPEYADKLNSLCDEVDHAADKIGLVFDTDSYRI